MKIFIANNMIILNEKEPEKLRKLVRFEEMLLHFGWRKSHNPFLLICLRKIHLRQVSVLLNWHKIRAYFLLLFIDIIYQRFIPLFRSSTPPLFLGFFLAVTNFRHTWFKFHGTFWVIFFVFRELLMYW